MNDYSDIINLEHPEPKNHIRMSKENRASQFSPFAALSGYEDNLKEARRKIDQKIILEEDKKENLDRILLKLEKEYFPFVKITYFVKDLKKDGGYYRTIMGNFWKTNYNEKTIYLKSKEKILISNIYEIEIIEKKDNL